MPSGPRCTLISLALFLAMLGWAVVTLRVGLAPSMLGGDARWDILADQAPGEAAGFEHAAPIEKKKLEIAEGDLEAPPRPLCADCPVMPMQLDRPRDTASVDIYVLTGRCDDYKRQWQNCLNYLRDKPDEYLVERVNDPPPPCDEAHPMIFQSYWRGNAGPPIVFMLKSFLASQNLRCARYWMWVDGAPVTQVEADMAALRAEADFKASEEEYERKLKSAGPPDPNLKKPDRKSLKRPYTAIEHANALREIKLLEPFVTLRQFNLSQRLYETMRLNDTELETYREWKRQPPPPPLPKCEEKKEEAAKVNAADGKEKDDATGGVLKKDYGKKNDTQVYGGEKCTNDATPKVPPHVKLPKYEWPEEWLNPSAKLVGWAVAESDMVRLVLLDLFGGLYVDTDVLFLRDLRPYINTPADWAYAWGMQHYHNTALLHFHPTSTSLETIIRGGLANGRKFHPKELIGYLRPPGESARNTLSAERRLALFPSIIFDAHWPWTDGDHASLVLPQFGNFHSMWDGACDKPYEFAWLLQSGAMNRTTLDHTTVAQLRTFDRFLNGAPAYHMHGIVRTIQEGSWAFQLNRLFSCFWRGLCPNVYGEYRPIIVK